MSGCVIACLLDTNDCFRNGLMKIHRLIDRTIERSPFGGVSSKRIKTIAFFVVAWRRAGAGAQLEARPEADAEVRLLLEEVFEPQQQGGGGVAEEEEKEVGEGAGE